MKIPPSPIEIKDIALINLECQFVSPDEIIDTKKTFGLYNIDVDFAVKDESKPLYYLFVKCEVNYNTTPILPGYKIFAECVCIYDLKAEAESLKREY